MTGYSTQFALEAYADVIPGGVAATKVTLEVLGLNSGDGLAEVTSTRAEALVLVDANISVTGVFLEVLARVFVPYPYVPDRATPWTIKPDWKEGVTERLSWRTDVLTSQTGIEQRRRIRNSPRRVIEATYTVIGASRRLLDSFLSGPGAGYWHVPLWWEKCNLTAIANEGDSVLSIDLAGVEVAAGDTIMILGATPFIYEMVKVRQVNPNGVQLDLLNTLAQTWPVGTAVYPTKLCQLAADPAAITRKADDAAQVLLTFNVTEPNDYPRAEPPLNIGYPVITYRPNEIEDKTYQFERWLTSFDNDSGVPIRRDTALQAFRSQQVRFDTHGRQDYAAFRAFLFWMEGRLNPLFVSTNFRDLDLRPEVTVTPTDKHLYVRRSGFTEFSNQSSYGRSLVGVQFRDGMLSLRAVTASLVDPGGLTEVLEVDTPFNREVTSANVKRVSFFQLMRQDQDDLEILHVTDTTGMTTFTTTFRGTPETRDDGDYNPLQFTGSYVADALPPALPPDKPDDAPPPDPAPDPYDYYAATNEFHESDGSGGDGGDAGSGGSGAGDSGGGEAT